MILFSGSTLTFMVLSCFLLVQSLDLTAQKLTKSTKSITKNKASNVYATIKALETIIEIDRRKKIGKEMKKVKTEKPNK